MNKIEKLINELCPQGMEFRALGEVSDIYDGTHQTPKYTDNGVKFVSVENIKSLYNSSKYISNEDFDSDYKIKPQMNDVFMTRIGTIGACTVVDRDEALAFYVTLALIRSNPTEINSKYLKYILESRGGKIELRKKTLINAVPIKINLGDIGKINIPIPPLSIQKEIVKILDNFTQLEAELEAELEARKKQYEHYREELLSFGDDVEFRALGEVCGYVDYRGKTPKKTADGIFLVTAKNIRVGYIDYNTSQEFISENDYSLVMRRGLPEIGDVLITTEAPCGFVAQVDRKNIALAQRVIKYRSKYELLGNSFLKHYLLGNKFQQKLHKTATGSTVKGIKGSKLHKLTIPIPPLSKQKQIVAILDKFDALVNDISTGLPAEIAARKKQYEYYRNQLLTFKPLEAQDAN